MLLKLPNHDPGRHLPSLRKRHNSVLWQGAFAHQSDERMAWDEEIRGKCVRLVFLFLRCIFRAFEKPVFLTMEEDVSAFMKESEPKVVKIGRASCRERVCLGV